MRIAYVCADPGVPVFGRKGASVHVQEVIRALIRLGAEVHLFAVRLDGEPPADLAVDLVVHALPPVGKGEAHEREVRALALNEVVESWLAQEGPFDLVYERYSLWSHAGMTYAEDNHTIGVLEVNAPLIEEQANHRTLIHRTEAEEVARRAFAAADGLFAVSAQVAAYLADWPSAQGRIHVVPNGVDPDRFAPRHTPSAAAPFTVGFVGTLKPWHGVNTLVDAFAQLHAQRPGAQLLLVGDGPCRAEIEEQVTALELSAAVKLTGAVDPSQIPDLLSRMDVATAPYPHLDDFYFSPLKLYEYMAAGLPVVASRIGQIEEVIVHDETGLIANPGDAADLAEKLSTLHDDAKLRRRLGERARAEIVANHSWEKVARRILAVGRTGDESSGKGAASVPKFERSSAPFPEDRANTPRRRHGFPLNRFPLNRFPFIRLPLIRFPFQFNAFPQLWRVLRRFGPIIGRERWLILGALFAMLGQIGLRLLEPWPLKFIFDYLSGVAPTNFAPWLAGWSSGILLAGAALAMIAVSAAGAGMAYFNTTLLALAGNRVLTQVRADFYKHVLSLPLAFHTQARSGDLLNRLIGDMNRLQEVAVTAMLPLTVHALTLLGMLGLMYWLNPALALIALCTLPLTGLAMVRLSSRIRQAARKQRSQEGDMAAAAAETFNAMQVVQAYGLEPRLEEAFGGQNRKNLNEGVKTARLAAKLERSIDILIATGTALVIWYGARLVLSGSLTPGDLIVFMSYMKGAFRPMQDLAKYTGRIAKAAASGERVLEIFDVQPNIVDAPDARPLTRAAGELRFEDVSFGYTPGRPVLRGIDFTIRPGQRVALVGASGGGKSTLTQLLLRFYDPSAGRILLDGVDIRQIRLADLRRQFSYVLQESVLFAVSARDNIAFGATGEVDDGTDEDAVRRAAALANADGFLSALPHGYDTVLSERGSSLSGGQRQRVAVARAALRNAPIVILDEPTTGLDQESGQTVHAALDRLSDGRTTLIITHDLRAAESADHIYFVEAGEIRESGTHAQLLAQNGRYAALYAIQSAATREAIHAES
ncbi:ATP-binding cassette domain-containing protein [bacterium]|nr:ATP-binding cassette domain-containing protein [bacterium]